MLSAVVKWLLIIGLALYFSSCGGPAYRQHAGVFEPYVLAFEEAAHSQGKVFDLRRLTVQFASLPNKAGTCLRSAQLVSVDYDYWQTIEMEQREALIFHELGHCIINRNHRTDTTLEGRPNSLMFPSLLDTGTYRVYRSYYIWELFR